MSFRLSFPKKAAPLAVASEMRDRLCPHRARQFSSRSAIVPRANYTAESVSQSNNCLADRSWSAISARKMQPVSETVDRCAAAQTLDQAGATQVLVEDLQPAAPRTESKAVSLK